MVEPLDAGQIVEVEPLLVGAEAAGKLLGISRRHFTQLESAGQVGPMPVKLGRRSVWNYQEIKRWVAAGCPCRDVWLNGHGKAGGA